jgi:hypothetical protein
MKPVILYLIAALLFTFVLGFIDEGYYSLKTFESLGNILVLLVYMLLFWGAQLGFDWLLSRLPTLPLSGRKTLSVIVGLLLPITLIMCLAP